jgi:hypothetical protein
MLRACFDGDAITYMRCGDVVSPVPFDVRCTMVF